MDQVGVRSHPRIPAGPRTGAHRTQLVAEWTARALLAAAFLVPGLARICDPLAPALALERTGVSAVRAFSVATVGVVTGVEFWLAGTLLTSRTMRLVAPVGIAVVGLLTHFLIVLLSKGASASCGCMGSPVGRGDPAREVAGGLARNAGMLCVPGWLAWRSGPIGAAGGSKQRAARAPGGFRGSTIVEVMASISVNAILVAVPLPVPARSRAQSEITGALASLRQVHASTMPNAGDGGDSLPHIATPHRPWEPISVRGALLPGLACVRRGGLVLSVVALTT